MEISDVTLFLLGIIIPVKMLWLDQLYPLHVISESARIEVLECNFYPRSKLDYLLWNVKDFIKTFPQVQSHNYLVQSTLVASKMSYPEPSKRVSLYVGRQQDFGTHLSPGHELMSYQSSYDVTPQQCNWNNIRISNETHGEYMKSSHLRLFAIYPKWMIPRVL